MKKSSSRQDPSGSDTDEGGIRIIVDRADDNVGGANGTLGGATAKVGEEEAYVGGTNNDLDIAMTKLRQTNARLSPSQRKTDLLMATTEFVALRRGASHNVICESGSRTIMTRAEKKDFVKSTYGRSDTKQLGRNKELVGPREEHLSTSKPALALLTVGITCTMGVFFSAYIYLGGGVIAYLETTNDYQAEIKGVVLEIQRQMHLAKEELPCGKLSKCTANADLAGCEKILARKEELVMNVERMMIKMKRLIKLEQIPWSYGAGVSFALSLTTTIGYGIPSPTNDASRVFSVLYSLFGIPLTLGYLAYISKMMLQVLEVTYDFVKRGWFRLRIWFLTLRINLSKKRLKELQREERKKILMTAMLNAHSEMSLKLALLIGSVWMLLSIPMVFPLLKEHEDKEIAKGAMKEADRQWNAFTMFYFSFISLSTVGLGDYMIPVSKLEPLKRLWINFYLIVGLSITAMCVDRATQLLTDRLDRLNKLSESDPEMGLTKKSLVKYMLLGRRTTEAKPKKESVKPPSSSSSSEKTPEEVSSEPKRQSRHTRIHFRISSRFGSNVDAYSDSDDDDSEESTLSSVSSDENTLTFNVADPEGSPPSQNNMENLSRDNFDKMKN